MYRGISLTLQAKLSTWYIMEYSEKEITQADTALEMLYLADVPVSGHAVRSRMAAYGSPYKMRDILIHSLNLIHNSSDIYTLTHEGRKSAEVGFKAYIDRLDLREHAVPVREVKEKRPLWKLNRSEWIALAGVLTGILGVAISFLL